jgi:hypothetical protein
MYLYNISSVERMYYGFFSDGNRHVLNQIRSLLGDSSAVGPTDLQLTNPTPRDRALRCIKCGKTMRMTNVLKPTGRWPP